MKAKALLLSLFFTVAVIGLKAQDKYEYAIISYSPYWANINISIGEHQYETISVAENIKLKDRKLNAVLREVNKLQEQGWILFNTEAIAVAGGTPNAYNAPDYLFYLRKKKQ